MARYVCNNCGATVVDEEFCPTCGSWIDPLTTPAVKGPRGGDEYEEFDLDDSPPPPTRNGEPLICPSCGASNPSSNRHCEECGARLRQSPLPAAPRPAVQATAGVRAVIALSGLLGIVVLGALILNLFRDDTANTTTTANAGETTASTTDTTIGIQEPEPIRVLVANCTPEGLGGAFACSNLINGNDGEFQINWNDLPETEKTVVMELTFAQPMVVERIDWNNIEDERRFRLNYRVKGVTIEAEGNLIPVAQELQNSPGLQSFPFAAIRANWIRITIRSVYNAEVVEEQEPFDELAIDDITVIGYPAPDTTTSTAGTEETTTTTGG
ncbi:MAG: hypothetical protein ACRDWH_00255 [Acidimicrobiia bacterium]